MQFSPLFPGVAAAYSRRPSRLFGFALGCCVRIVSSFAHFLCFFCYGCFGRRFRLLCFHSCVCFSTWIACEGPRYRGFRNPVSDPTGSVCRRRASRFSRGPIWQRTPYGLYYDHIVVMMQCRVSTYYHFARPSLTVVVTLLGSFLGCGVQLACRADHRVPHPSSGVCLFEIYGSLTSF